MAWAEGAMSGSATTEPPVGDGGGPATPAAASGVSATSGRGAPCGPRPGGGANSGRSVGKRITSRIESTLAEQHDQPVDPDAEPAGARHALFERAHVVQVDVARLGVAARLGPRLGLERRELRHRVVLLGVGVAQLEARDDQLEAFDVVRVVAVHAGQGETSRG